MTALSQARLSHYCASDAQHTHVAKGRACIQDGMLTDDYTLSCILRVVYAFTQATYATSVQSGRATTPHGRRVQRVNAPTMRR